VLSELVTDVLGGPGGQVPAHLRPLADGLVSMRRPQSGAIWLRRSAIARETLQGLAHGRIPCSHAALDVLRADRAVEYLRCLLVRYGVLPPRDRRLADFQRWAAAKLDGVGNAEHRQLLERFLRWRLLRHLRSGGATAVPVGHGPYQRAKQRLTVAIAFLAWLAGRGRQHGIPARASRLAAWRELVRQSPPAVLADALGGSPGTAMRHAVLAGADWSAFAAHRSAPTLDAPAAAAEEP
jgi:hypothetical protein